MKWYVQVPFLLRTQAMAVHRQHKENRKHNHDNLIKTYLRLRFFAAVKVEEITFKNTFCPAKHLCFLACRRKVPPHVTV